MTITSIKNLSKLVSTAVASYADLRSLESDLSKPDNKADFTVTQATQFVANYELIHQMDNDSVGFSASVFRDKTTQKLVLAVRGTEIPSDVGSDLFQADIAEISPSGYAKSQASSLYRYWRKLTTVSGAKVQYSESEILKLFALTNGSLNLLDIVTGGPAYLLFRTSLQSDTGIDATAGTSLVDPNAVVDVTGHSLGGHLAMLFSRFFPQNTDQVVTINAPGFFPGSSLLTTIGIPAFNDSKITRLEADGDGISELGFPFFWPGTKIAIAQENGKGVFDPLALNHSSVNGNDSLSLMAVLSRLDPGSDNNTQRLSDIVRFGSNKPEESYEKVTDGLRHILLGKDQADTPISKGANDLKRKNLYENLYDLMKLDASGNPTGIFADLANKVTLSTNKPTNARKDIGQFLSLYYLTPFTLQAQDSATGTLVSAQGTVGTQWQADRELNPQQKAEGKATFSDEYLVDRTAMWTWVTKRNNEDITAPTMDGPDFRYIDVQSEIEIRIGGFDDAVRRVIYFGDDTAKSKTGGEKNDRLYGGAGNDTIDGANNGDYIEGNEGDDTLKGGQDDKSNDILRGGNGYDTYIFDGNFGHDIIKDSDGKGSIKIDGAAISIKAGGIGKPNHWMAGVNGSIIEFTLLNDSSSTTGKRLNIKKNNSSTDSITIENFDLKKAQSAEGYLGIKLDESVKLVIKKGSELNVFRDINFDATSLAGQTTSLPEGTGNPFTIYLNQAAKAGDTITLNIGGPFKAILGDSKVDASGAVIALVEGQTEVSFGLVQEGNVDADANYQLTAQFKGADGTATSNVFGVELKDTGKFDNVLLGDQKPRPKPVVPDYSGDFKGVTIAPGHVRYHDEAGVLLFGNPNPGWDDVLYSYSLADQILGRTLADYVKLNGRITGLGGNDALGGGSMAMTK